MSTRCSRRPDQGRDPGGVKENRGLRARGKEGYKRIGLVHEAYTWAVWVAQTIGHTVETRSKQATAATSF